MWQEVHQDEMEILGVPCGQFFNVRLNLKPDFDIFTQNCKIYQQEPSGDPTEIANVIRHVRPGNGFEPTFPLFARCSNPQTPNFASESQIILLKPDPMSTEQRESPCTSGLWCGFRFNSVKTDNKQLQSRCPSPVPTFFEDANLLLYSPMSQEDVRWNWEKVSSTKFSIWIFFQHFLLRRRYMCKTRFNGEVHYMWQGLRNCCGKNHLRQQCSSFWKYSDWHR